MIDLKQTQICSSNKYMYLRTRLINKHCVGHTSRLKIIADLISNVYSEGTNLYYPTTLSSFPAFIYHLVI